MNPDRPYDPIPFAVIDSITVADLDRLFHVAGATHGRGHTSTRGLCSCYSMRSG